jgi:hypothetical protein
MGAARKTNGNIPSPAVITEDCSWFIQHGKKEVITVSKDKRVRRQKRRKNMNHQIHHRQSKDKG